MTSIFKPGLKRILFFTLVLATTSCGGTSGGSTSGGSPAGGLPVNYALAWADEFDVAGYPDAAKWNHDTFRNSQGWYNNELQYYSSNRLANSKVENGRLIITARKEDLTTAADYGGQHYTSARLITNGRASWTYGFYEVRAKLPCGQGTWPAIWTLGTGGIWPDDGELDIMEQTGANPTTILGTTHTASSGGPGVGGHATLTDACTAFHNYQMTWTADYVAFGIDNVNYFRYDNPKTGTRYWPFDNPQYLILNVAIGGTLGGTVNDSIFPVQMEVEYVRVYQPKP